MVAESDNKQKLNQFFSEEYKSMKGYIKSGIKSSVYTDPEDIIQDVAAKMFERADNLAPIKNIAGFVYRSIKNKIIDIMRTSKTGTHLDERFDDFVGELSSDYIENSDNSYSDEIKNELHKAISSLKPKYKEIIYAVDFEGISFKKLSKQTNVPIGTLLSRHHRALSILTEQLEQIKHKN
jgi:RNA polymerase sigma-70 factor (ECF subfamily)